MLKPFGRGLGWKRDPAKRPGETPDLVARPRLRAMPPPARASVRNLLGPTLNQGHLGSCVANAGARAIRASHARQGVVDPPLGSRLFAYFLARAMDHSTAFDSGTFVRNFFQTAVKFGLPPEQLWPYSDADGPGAPFRTMPPPEVFRAAYDQSGRMGQTRYYRINTTGDERVADVKRAIAAGFPVVFGTDVSIPFCDGVSSDPVQPPRDLPIAGGHCMLVGEYEPGFAGVANSWGEGWGEAGWCRFSWDYIKWESSEDFWLVDTAPTFSEP